MSGAFLAAGAERFLAVAGGALTAARGAAFFADVTAFFGGIYGLLPGQTACMIMQCMHGRCMHETAFP